jgi:PAS domain S-box-containing protein
MVSNLMSLMNLVLHLVFLGIAVALGVVAWRQNRRARRAERALGDREGAAPLPSGGFADQIVNTVSDPIFVKDLEHRLVYVNDAECRLSGHDREALIGKTDYDFFPKEQVDVFWNRDDRVFETGMEDANEEVITQADGRIRTIVTKKTRYTARDGSQFLVGIIRDITDRKLVEEEVRKLNLELEQRVSERTAELRRSNRALEEDIANRRAAERALSDEKERLSVTLRSIGEGVIAVDTHDRIQLMNNVAEQLTGWTIREAVGRPVAEVLQLRPSASADTERAGQLPDILTSAGVVAIDKDLALLDRTGNARSIAINAAPIRPSASELLGRVIVFRDITDKLRIDELITNTQRIESIGLLAGGIAHDFNNLLTGLFGYIELARASRHSVEDAEQNLDGALTAWRRARDLTRQLLTFSKGGSPIKRVAKIGPLIREDAEFALSGRAIRCTFDLPDDLWLCEIDESQIGQVVDNVVINAVQAMRGQGQLVVEGRNVLAAKEQIGMLAAGRYVHITFKDSGPGMAPEVLRRVFDPYFTTKPEGNGLGLTMVFSIIKKHGGHIDVQSQPGHGTVVRISLPATDAADLQQDVLPPARPRGSSRILVIEDELLVRNVLSAMLKNAGYRVDCCEAGAAGVLRYDEELRAGNRFDVVILDLTLPGELSGKDTLARLRQIDPQVVAIASSGYSEDPVFSDPGKFGFAETLPKPYSNEMLLAALHRAGHRGR